MRILVVEDEHRIAAALKKGLEQETYAVDVAYDGLVGYDLASEETYDAIILDLMVPKIDGIEICRRLRASGNHTPILMLTARSQIQDKVFGLNCGADDYMTKPFSFEELVARIRVLMRRNNHPGEKTTLQAGDITLDYVSKQVTRGEDLIILSAKEFALLEYLMRNAGKIISKQQIIDHVWNYDADILPNTVEVYIKNIRNKIEKPDLPALIVTIRGFGYKIGS